VRPGEISLISSIRFVLCSVAIRVRPVILPPGRAKLGTMPMPTASPMDAMTMGIVLPSDFHTQSARGYVRHQRNGNGMSKAEESEAGCARE
jgi:hypothetical protein